MTLSSYLLEDIPSTTNLSELLPAGIIIPFASDPASAPSGFVFCRGQLEAKATYPNLNAVIGDGPGAGNPGYHGYNNGVDPGAGNMRMPNMQNISPLGAGTTAGVARSGSGGAAIGGVRPHSHDAGTYTLPAHTHTAGTLVVAAHGHGHSFSMGDHDHSLDTSTKAIYGSGKFPQNICHFGATEGGASVLGFGGSVSNASTIAVSGSTASATPTISGTTATDDGPYLVLNFLIKT